MDKEYFELTITTDEKYIDLLSDTICTISDEGIEIGKNQIIIRSENDLIPLQNQLKDILSSIDEIEADFLLSKKENSDWIAAYQSSIEPIESGEFYIHPSWHEPKEGKINITIDPALAFGSGHHATTSSCLEMISRHLQKHHSVIDVGCGSGILALACSKKGATAIDLCDTDPLAIQSTKENFAKNNQTFNDCWEGSTKQATKSYDIVLANIIADVLVLLSKDLKKITKKDGLLILSGILDKKVDKVFHAFKDLQLLDKILKDEWVTLVYKKDDNVK